MNDIDWIYMQPEPQLRDIIAKVYPLGVVLTGTTGINLCEDFSQFHEMVMFMYDDPWITQLGLSRYGRNNPGRSSSPTSFIAWK